MEQSVKISSKRQIIQILLVFVIPFLCFFASYNGYMIKKLNENQAQVGQNLIAIYKSPVKKDIELLQTSVVDMIANDSDFQQMVYSNKAFEKYAYLQKVSTKLQRYLNTETPVGAILYEKNMDLMNEVYTESELYDYREKQQFKDILRTYVNAENERQNGWKVWEVNGKHYLMRVFEKKDVYAMILFDLNRTPGFSRYGEVADNSFLFFADEDMMPLTMKDKAEEIGIQMKKYEDGKYYITGNTQKYLVVQDNFEEVPLRILYAAPYYSIFSSSDKGPFVFMLFSCVLIALLWISYRMLEKKYLNPFQNLVSTMEAIKQGNMEAKMSNQEKILEFNILAHSFNEMMQEVQALKIASYESQIEMQQAKLQYFQIQIRPHFFLNCLKNLYGLAEEGKPRQIQQTIVALSGYLRFIMQDSFYLVPVSMELQNVENYILLQKLTSQHPVICNIDVEEALRSYEIPPISILTFVENSIKHGELIDKQLKIQIKINQWMAEDMKYISVMILDNGTGFSEESLRELNGESENTEDTRHIGIQNVKQRFSIIYKRKATFLFSNMTGSGACVQILIPVTEETGEKAEGENSECTDYR